MKYRIRIAVAIAPKGTWNAAGWGNVLKEDSNDQEAMDLAVDSTEEGERRYFVEAEIELPEASVVVGIVESA